MAILPALTSLLAFVFALMLVDQWRERRHGFQAVWAFGMLWVLVTLRLAGRWIRE